MYQWTSSAFFLRTGLKEDLESVIQIVHPSEYIIENDVCSGTDNIITVFKIQAASWSDFLVHGKPVSADS